MVLSLSSAAIIDRARSRTTGHCQSSWMHSISKLDTSSYLSSEHVQRVSAGGCAGVATVSDQNAYRYSWVPRCLLHLSCPFRLDGAAFPSPPLGRQSAAIISCSSVVCKVQHDYIVRLVVRKHNALPRQYRPKLRNVEGQLWCCTPQSGEMELATQEDELVRCVFAITLDAGRANTDANPPVVHLAGLAEVCTGRWSPCKWS